MLSTGDFKFLVTEGKKLSYSRSEGNDEIIVMFNLEKDQQKFSLPQNAGWTDLMTNKTITGNSIVLKPLTAVILKKTK